MGECLFGVAVSWLTSAVGYQTFTSAVGYQTSAFGFTSAIGFQTSAFFELLSNS
ncbi:hypothetical protein [Dyadobacter sp.]|uniref:hypothetical protein n=1 Tax=Dyadobacter sp. TaxID=1914288 RepID=UPI003F710B8E